jgi:hypothetical protein
MTTRRLLPLALSLALAVPAVVQAQYSYRRPPVWGGGGIGASRSAEQIAAEQVKNTPQPYVIYVAQPGYVIIPHGYGSSAYGYGASSSYSSTSSSEAAMEVYRANRSSDLGQTGPTRSASAARTSRPEAGTAPSYQRTPVGRSAGAIAAEYRRKFGNP